jgi:opacity protein-like surface antigen
MNRSITAAVALAVALAASSVHADEEQGLYIGGGVGQVNVDIDDFDDLATTVDKYSSDDTAYKLFAGWRFNKNIALQLDYSNYGSPTDEILPGVEATTEIDGFQPNIVGTLPLGPVELFAKAGYLFYNVDFRIRGPGGTTSIDGDGQEFVYGAGLGFTVLGKLNVRAEYEVLEVDDVDDVNSLWLTAAWRF